MCKTTPLHKFSGRAWGIASVKTGRLVTAWSVDPETSCRGPMWFASRQSARNYLASLQWAYPHRVVRVAYTFQTSRA